MSDRVQTHYPQCWRSHLDCAIHAVEMLAEGAEVVLLDVLATDDEDPNALEMKHRLHLLGFADLDLIDHAEET